MPEHRRARRRGGRNAWLSFTPRYPGSKMYIPRPPPASRGPRCLSCLSLEEKRNSVQIPASLIQPALLGDDPRRYQT